MKNKIRNNLVILLMTLIACLFALTSCNDAITNDNSSDTDATTEETSTVESSSDKATEETSIAESSSNKETEETTSTVEEIKPRVDAWDGTVASAFAGGSGSKANPYVIETGEQLAYLARTVKNGNAYDNCYILLTCDLDLKNIQWTPIGDYKTPFKGNFDGGGHTIKNFKPVAVKYNNGSDSSSRVFAGLFGICEDASFCDLSFDNVSITVPTTYDYDYTYVGVLAARFVCNSSAQISNIRVSSANINVVQVYSRLYVGGCIGYLSVETAGWFSADRLQCTANFKIENNEDKSFIGGIVGYCHNRGNSEVSDFVCYQNVNWTRRGLYDYGSHYAGAFAGVYNDCGRIKMENAFAEIVSGKEVASGSSVSGSYEFEVKAIIGASGSSEEEKDSFYFRNLFGCVYVKPRSEYRYELYYVPDRVTENNCKACVNLPQDHGLPESVWDLSNLNKPVLK